MHRSALRLAHVAPGRFSPDQLLRQCWVLGTGRRHGDLRERAPHRDGDVDHRGTHA